MITSKLKESDVTDINFIDKLISEVTKVSIPNKFHKHFINEDLRKELLESYGSEAFLLPEETKFPVINPETGKCDCRLIYVARLRAKQHGLTEIEEKAEELYHSNNCGTRININIEGHEHGPYDFVELLTLLEFDFKSLRESKKEVIPEE